MKSRIIVCGLGRTGYRIFYLLKQQGASVVGISDRPLAVAESSSIVVGDLRDPVTFYQAGIKEAHTLVLASHDDALNLAILTLARTINPRLRIINRLYNQALGERLDQTLPDHVSLSVSALAAPLFAFAALGDRAIGRLQLFGETWPIQEIIIADNHPWRGLPLSELWDNPARMLIYHLPACGETDLISAVLDGKRLELGDRIIVGNRPVVQTRRPHLLQRLLKTLLNLRRYRQQIRPVLVVSLVLLMTIGMATITYISTSLNTSLVDALYFSVGMITGAGGQEQVAESASDVVKVFTVIMMVVGAAVIGICYALINDFILGSRLKQAWEAARVPSRHHFIVCGLSGLGLQIVRQFHSQGREVVVIECDRHNRFLHAVRSLGVPVINEDATLATTLKMANASRAEALLAVTSNDTLNVEIALTAKAVAPKLFSIVRAQDSQFGQSAQEVFEFDAVLCPSELATYSFAAAALGGKILGSGMTEDLLWIALATLITPQHPFNEQRISQAGTQRDFVPLYLERQGQLIRSWQLLETYLQVGDVLYLAVPATKLEQLWPAFPSSVSTSSWG